MSKWKEIWNNRERVHKIILEILMKADGFDSPTGEFSIDDWIEYTNTLYARLDIKENESIFEVGCGSGAFVYPLFQEGYRVGGIDYSEILIKLAKSVMDNENFINGDALDMDEKDKYDFVISHSVFFYFDSLSYAKKVIEKMIKKADKAVAIFDINDIEKEKDYHKTRIQTMSKEEYEKKYQGLNHLFYSKEFFISIATEHNLEIEIWDQEFEKYNNSKFRFNVIMRKRVHG
jgi:2-polyprenyl-3-methyl-5-hydroxy-6-metoxy-1,4-benzoquinol methylase